MSSEVETVGDIVQNTDELLDDSLKNEACIEEADNNLWQKKEKELENKLAEYETALLQEKQKNASLQKDLQARTEERDSLKNQTVKLEKELAKKSLNGSKDQDINPNDMVTQARSVIFEKTKVCKNQELQIEAFTQQVKSLKEIVSISKDMLEIRNMEVKQLQDKLDCIELKFTAEKDRHALMHTKLDRMVTLNSELKTEYQKQLQLFSELQNAYKKRQDTLEASNQESNTDGV